MSDKPFTPLNIAVLTVSDTRTEVDDKSGRYLVTAAETSGHGVAEKSIVPDNIYKIRALVSKWVEDEAVNAVIITGGTGVTGRDITPEAVSPLLDRVIDGFGELFRYLSFEEIGSSTLQSRALCGTANNTFIFCLPGSTGACRTAWEKIIKGQLDIRTEPCNFSMLIPRLLEK